MQNYSMIGMVKGLCIVYKNSSHRLAFMESYVPCSMSINARVVERPRSTPNCLVSNLSAMAANTRLPTNDSSTLHIVGVSDMGHKSLSTDCTGRVLATGTTFAFFQEEGTCKNGYSWLTGSVGIAEKSRRNRLGMPSGPGTFRLLIFDNR